MDDSNDQVNSHVGTLYVGGFLLAVDKAMGTASLRVGSESRMM